MKSTYAKSSEAPSPEHISPSKTYQLSSRQMGLWLYQQREPESCLYNVCTSFYVNISIDAEKLAEIVNSALNYHPAFKTYFVESEGGVSQGIAPERCFDILFYDRETSLTLKEQVKKLNKKPFDLSKDELLRVHIISCGDNKFLLNYNLHHIIGDAVTAKNIASSLSVFLNANFNGAMAEPCLYSNDFYTSNILKYDQANHEAEEYWKAYLQNVPLSLDFNESSVNCDTECFTKNADIDKKGIFEFEMSPKCIQDIKDFSRKSKISAFCFFSAVYGCILSRISRTDIFAMSYLRDVRSKDAVSLTGFFIEKLPLVVNLQNTASIIDVAKTIRKNLSAHKKTGKLSLAKILDNQKLDAKQRSQCLNVGIGQTIFDGFELEGESSSDAFSLEHFYTEVGATDCILNLLVGIMSAEGKFRLNYDKSVFSEWQISELASCFTSLIDQVLQNPNKPLQEYELVDAKQYESMHPGIAYHEQTFPTYSNIAQIFVERVNASPDALAVIEEQQNFTYAEIERMSNAIGNGLLSDGVVAGDAVGVCMDRSGVFMASLLAILKIGAVYVPIVSTLPEQRVGVIVTDSKIQLVLAEEQYADLFSAVSASLEISSAAKYLHSDSANSSEITPYPTPELALVLYTSGSTGRPKGVELFHDGMINTVSHYYRGQESEAYRILCRTSPSFDLSLLELFGAFIGGCGAAVMLPGSYELDIDNLINFTNRFKVTHSVFVPTVLKSVLDRFQSEPNLARFPAMRSMVVCGEKFSAALYQDIQKCGLGHISIENDYGPTETSLYSTSFNIKDWNQSGNQIPIGKAISNIRVYILDENLKLLPKGIPGEICIGGVGVGKGYRNLPEKTAAAFVDSPFIPGEKLYRTGDWGMELEDGNLAVLGRFDEQVKLRGQRIELLEIEAAAQQLDAIEQAVAVIKTTPVGEALAMYYTTSLVTAEVTDKEAVKATNKAKSRAKDRAVNPEQIKSHLAGLLPSYMVPQYVVELEAIPMLMSGKIDRKTLQAKPLDEAVLSSGNAESSSDYVTSGCASSGYVRSVTEAKLLSVWREVLQSQQVAVTDNFFDAGGHSLLVVELIQNINQTLGAELTVTDFFRAPNVRDMAALIAPDEGLNELPELEWEESTSPSSQAIAIIGMACQFPYAANKDAFWDNLVSGKEGIANFSESELLAGGECALVFSQPDYVPRRGVITHAKQFDHKVFNYSPRDAELIDPQQRLFLANAYHALEDGGYGNVSETQHVGVYGGAGFSDYANHVRQHEKFGKSISFYQMMTGNANDFLCTRVAYKLNLSGPAINIQTACSTSLVAVERACRDLREGLCDMALAGGVSLVGGIDNSGYVYQEGMILSPDGRCRAFDAAAGGTVPGQGVGVVLLKPLSEAVKDNDNIYAVIEGVAVNNDGNRKAGFTAPDIHGQSEVIRQAQRDARVTPQDITYLETHGTATPMGDPIEIAALAQTWQANAKSAGSRASSSGSFSSSPNRSDSTIESLKPSPVQIGAVKSNLGHTDTAAGIAGLIKTALCLKNRLFVPTLHFNQPNPALDLENTPFTVNTKTRPWDMPQGKRRMAGVSAFGIGGTNAHVVIAEDPGSAERVCEANHIESPNIERANIENLGAEITNAERAGAETGHSRDNFDATMLLPISAATPESLSRAQQVLQQFLNETDVQQWPDISYTAQTGRTEYGHRSCFVLQQKTTLNEDKLITLLTAHENPFAGMNQLSMCFYGVNSEIQAEYYITLYKQCFIYADSVNEVLEQFDNKLGVSLKPIFAGTVQVDCVNFHLETSLFGWVAELAFARTLQNAGMQFSSVVGEGAGELAACCFAGALNITSAMNVLVRMQTVSEVPVAQVSTQLPLYLLSNHCWVLPGNEFQATFNQLSQVPKRLNFDVIFTQLVQKDGTSSQPGAVISFVNDYLFNDNNLVELDLLGFSEQPDLYDLSAKLYAMLGYWWMAQHPVDWRVLYPYGEPGRVSMPGYQFDTQTFWLDRPMDLRPFNGAADLVLDNNQAVDANVDSSLPTSSPDMPAVNQEKVAAEQRTLPDVQAILSQIWCDHLNLPAINPDDDFFELGGESLMAIGVFEDIEHRLNVKMQISVLYQASTLRLFTRVVEQELAVVSSLNSENAVAQIRAAQPGQIGNEAEPMPAEIDASPLVLLQQGTDPEQKPIFLIHAAGGGLIHFANMIKALGEQITVYGFEAPSLMTFDSIEAMATCYLNALIKAIPNESHFIIGGHSFGGIVALEMGHQLKVLGKQLTQMLLIDPPGPDKMPQHTRYYSQILLHLCQGKVQPDEKYMRSLSLEAQIQYMRDQAGEQQWKSHFYYITPAYIRRFKREVDMMHTYEFVPLDCDSIYFSPKEMMPLLPKNMFESWELLTLGTMQVVETEGNHITMVSENGAKTIARTIRRNVVPTAAHPLDNELSRDTEYSSNKPQILHS